MLGASPLADAGFTFIPQTGSVNRSAERHGPRGFVPVLLVEVVFVSHGSP